MVGVDPDAGVRSRPWLDEGHQMLVEQYAQMLVEQYAATAAERFDVALCVYVVEHVERPSAFFEAVRSVLRPGGSCFGVTPNLLHYFGLTSAAATRLGIEDWLLRRVRSPDLIEAYHSPVRYRCNTTWNIRAAARRGGFSQSEFRVLEQAAMFDTYFPPPLRWWPKGYSRVVNRWAPPELFGTLLFRLTA
jgi:SAM-dependent methyltransferase